jgi:acetolactate synthase-1/2/3 large subunit
MGETENNSTTKSPVDRRNFLKIATTGAAALVAGAQTTDAQETQAAKVDDSSPASSSADVLTTGRTGSDFMVDVLKSLGFEYIFSNPGSSFRALQESFINYGGNKNPEWLTCLHEESSVAMAHGYAKIEHKPVLVLASGAGGLQHATLPIYLAFAEQVPVYVLVGDTIDATQRRPEVDWLHSAQDQGAIVRDYTKWDDTPHSLDHFAESAVRAYKISMTPPQLPVLIVADTTMQEDPIPAGTNQRIPKLTLPAAPEGDAGSVAEAARLLAGAENPVILTGRAPNTASGMKLLVELAETLQAAVIGMNFPSRHPLSQSGRRGATLANADVILGLDMYDFYGSLHNMRDQLHRSIRSITMPTAKMISIGTEDLYIRANYQEFQRFQEVDLAIAADAEATLPALTEAVKKLVTADRKSAFVNRGAKLAAANQQTLERVRDEARYAWDASPISTARLAAEVWAQIKDKDWSLVTGDLSNWPIRLWNFDKPYYQWVNGSKVATASPISVGAALANRKYGRLSVHFQDDGDLMYAPGVLWTAAHHRIPMLKIMNNNRAYHTELMHLQRMANRKNHDLTTAGIGTKIEDPNIDYAKLAQSMGWYAEGPIADPKDLAPALKRAIAVVERGEPALLDTVMQPR